MTRGKRRIAKELPGPAPVAEVVRAEEVEEYTFLTTVRCPRCGNTRTMIYAGARTKSPHVRYRMCMSPICRWKFKEIGKLLD